MWRKPSWYLVETAAVKEIADQKHVVEDWSVFERVFKRVWASRLGLVRTRQGDGLTVNWSSLYQENVYLVHLICTVRTSILASGYKVLSTLRLQYITCCITTLIIITTLIDSKLGLSSTTTATARATTFFFYYVMCLEARFYDYLALSEIKKKLSSNSSQLRCIRKCTHSGGEKWISNRGSRPHPAPHQNLIPHLTINSIWPPHHFSQSPACTAQAFH